jgi:FtsP/CotA-like multicopper oxidase with cupredoxin domain
MAASAALTILWLVGGCTGQQSSSPGVAASPAAPSSAPASSPAAETSATPGKTESTTTNALTIDVTISGGKVSPSGRKIDVAKGQKVVLNVTSDVDEEVHAHALGDGYQLNVSAGKPATGSFVVRDPGSFYVEAHHLEKVIVILNVR